MKAICKPERKPACSAASPVAYLFLTVFLAGYNAWAQADENTFRSSSDSTTYPSLSLIGEWGRESIASINHGGRREEVKLSTPYGLLSIDPSENYTLQLIFLRRLPDSLRGRLTSGGGDLANVAFESYAHFGQVYIDGTNLHLRVIRSSVPTWNGEDLHTPFVFRDGQLIFAVALPTDGNSKGLDAEAVWRRSTPQTEAITDEAARDCTNRTSPIHERYSVGESRIDK